ncbi:MAG: hypothetical protein CFH08_02174, partial [Alphaproteobacteria bacterium MarineAlpha3_Bin7]
KDLPASISEAVLGNDEKVGEAAE